MEINRSGLFWYETRCRVRDVKPVGERSWTMRLSCEGEGKRYSARSRVSLPAPDRLVLDDAPVGPTKRQTYVRCRG